MELCHSVAASRLTEEVQQEAKWGRNQVGVRSQGWGGQEPGGGQDPGGGQEPGGVRSSGKYLFVKCSEDWVELCDGPH